MKFLAALLLGKLKNKILILIFEIEYLEKFCEHCAGQYLDMMLWPGVLVIALSCNY